jgi:hypothetical protein
MKDQKSSSESGVMKAAASAQTRISSWSASKKDFANRITKSGSFGAQQSSSPSSGNAAPKSSDRKA